MTREEAIHIVKTTNDWGELRMALAELVPELAESEDERIRKKAIEYIGAFVPYDDKDEILSWLEKQKEQKPDDDRYMEGYMRGIGEQKPAEWSEEDLLEWIRKNVRSYVNSEYNEFHHTVEYDGSINTDKLIQDLKNWLKSLRPNHWKPSEEQMDWVGQAIIDSGNETMKVSLRSLYNDLKKL